MSDILSDEEVHNRVVQAIRSLTREEAQAMADTNKLAFDRQEAVKSNHSRSKIPARPKPAVKAIRKKTAAAAS